MNQRTISEREKARTKLSRVWAAAEEVRVHPELEDPHARQHHGTPQGLILKKEGRFIRTVYFYLRHSAAVQRFNRRLNF